MWYFISSHATFDSLSPDDENRSREREKQERRRRAGRVEGQRGKEIVPAGNDVRGVIRRCVQKGCLRLLRACSYHSQAFTLTDGHSTSRKTGATSQILSTTASYGRTRRRPWSARMMVASDGVSLWYRPAHLKEAATISLYTSPQTATFCPDRSPIMSIQVQCRSTS